ncbi:MAG: DMT family transporter [bacterium]|nr:DMT family transporter [bacterium]
MTHLAPRRHRILAEIGLLYAAAIWGATFFIVKDVISFIDPVVLVGYRFALAGVLLAGYLAIKRVPMLVGLKDGLILGVILWALYIPQTIGLGFTSAANSGFITGLFVVIVPILAYALFHKKPSRWEAVALVLSLAGLWFLTGGISGMNFGDLITLIAAFFYALHLLYCDKYMKAGRDPIVISAQQFLLVGALSFVTAWLFDLPFSIGNRTSILTVIFLTLLPTLSAFLIQLYAQKLTSPFRVSLIFALEPVFAAIFAWTLGGEEFVIRSAAGGLLIFVAMIVAELPAAGVKK